MKTTKLLMVIAALIFTVKMKSQTCIPNFTYTLNTNGNITFSNTSIPANATVPTTYVWNIGNGTTFTTSSLGQPVSTTFTSNGNYEVTLSMRSSASMSVQLCSSVTTQVIPFTIPGCPLSASISAINAVVASPTVIFTSLSTGTNLGTTYIWGFGDGTTGTGISATHIYPGVGMYHYTLTAINNPTCSALVSVNPNYGGATQICDPIPFISYTTGPGNVTTFSANNVGSPHNSQVFWSFGDNTYEGYDDISPSHIYFNGVYSPSLYINVGNCLSSNYTVAPITITNNPCVSNAAFTYTVGSGGLVQFAVAGSTNTNAGYLWNFGDGIITNQVNPTHTYPSSGSYTVMLRSYDLNSFPILSPMDSAYVSLPCRKFTKTNINITGIPCTTNLNFNVLPSGTPLLYYLSFVTYPYSIAAATWSWGDGSTSPYYYYINTTHNYAAAGTYDVCLTVTTTCGFVTSYCVNQAMSKGGPGGMLSLYVISPELSTGIDETNEVNTILELFPNPSTGILNLKVDKELNLQEIEIFDLLGKQVYFNSSVGKEEKLQLDLSELNNGIYLLRMKSSQKLVSKKFIIAR